MDVEAELIRLRSQVRLLTGFLAFAVAALIGARWLQSELAASMLPHVHRVGSEVVVSAPNDGPFVITHLVASGTGESEKRWAAIEPPAAYVDSGGVRINLEGLRWRDLRGRPADPPPSTAPLRALFFTPSVAAERQP